MPVHVHSGAADKASYGAVRRHVRHRGAVVVGPAAVVPAVVGRVRAPSRTCGSSSPSAARSGPPTCCGRWTPSTTASTAPRSSAQQLTAGLSHAAERVLRPQLRASARRTPAAASWPGATRSASATSCGATTSRTPRARGRTRGSGCATRSATSPSTRPRRCSGGNAAEVYGFDVDALRPLADRIGPTPDELGQDGRRPRASGTSCGPPAGRGSPASRRSRPASGRDAARSVRPVRAGLRRLAVRPVPPAARGTSRCTGRELLSGWVLTRFDDVSPVLRDHSVSSELDSAKPSPVVDLLRARSARNAAQRDGDDPRAAATTPSTPAAQAACSAVHRPRDRASCATSVQERVDARPRPARRRRRDGRAHRRLRLPAAGRGVLRDARHPRRGRPALPGVDRGRGPQPRPRDQRGGLRRVHGPARGDAGVPVRRGRREAGRARRRRAVAAACTREVDGERLTHAELVAATRHALRGRPRADDRADRQRAASPCSSHPEQLAALQADPSLRAAAPSSRCCATTARTSSCAGSPPRTMDDRRPDDRRRRRPLPVRRRGQPRSRALGRRRRRGCASTGPTPASTCSSAAASTTASAPTSPASRPRWRSRRCSPGSPTCAPTASRPGPAAPPSAASAPCPICFG